MHLVIGENRANQKRFMRLKRYMNWFGIPDLQMLQSVQIMLKKGAQELGWAYDEQQDIKLKAVSAEAAQAEIAQSELETIPDEILDFIRDYPRFTKDLISLNIKTQDREYIFELLEIIDAAVNQAGERLKVAFKEVLKKISVQEEKSMNELTDLMGKWNLYEITSLVNIIKRRLETIDTFEQMILDDKTYEINTDNSVHRIFEKSMWLIDESYWIIQSNKTLRTFIGDEIVKQTPEYKLKRPDFACVNTENRLIIIEIKRPSLELGKQEIDQAELYQRLVKKYTAKKYAYVEVYLIGNKISEEAREIVEYRKGVQIKTYSELLADCRKRYQEYLQAIGK